MKPDRMTAPEPLTADEVRALREVAERADRAPMGSTERILAWQTFEEAADPETVLHLLEAAESHAAMVARVGALADEWEKLVAGYVSPEPRAQGYARAVAIHARRLRAALGGIDDGEGSR